MPKLTKFNWQEPVAYATAILVVLIGIWMTSAAHPTSINRAGSLVIVVGIILAASPKYDVLYKEVIKFITAHKEANFDKAIAEVEKKSGRKISKKRRAEISDRIDAEMSRDLEEIFYARRRGFKIHELVLVAIGTLLNGFGDAIWKFFLQ